MAVVQVAACSLQKIKLHTNYCSNFMLWGTCLKLFRAFNLCLLNILIRAIVEGCDLCKLKYASSEIRLSRREKIVTPVPIVSQVEVLKGNRIFNGMLSHHEDRFKMRGRKITQAVQWISVVANWTVGNYERFRCAKRYDYQLDLPCN